jgi:hypothetical protein
MRTEPELAKPGMYQQQARLFVIGIAPAFQI